MVDGKLYYRENSVMNPVDLPVTTTNRMIAMIGLRDTVRELLQGQLEDASDAQIAAMQHMLNAQYDDFSRQYGFISSTANRRAFQQDSSYCLLAALEVLDENGQLKRKADIFTKRTIRKPEPVESVDTASEALALSIGERARVDLPYMASLCGRTEKEIIDELRGVIFLNPDTVNRAVSYTTNQPIISTPKTKSGKRVIPLDDQLVTFLKPHLDTGYIIGGKEPPTLMVTCRLLRNLDKKINMFGATPHVFRHSYISALAEAGVDLKTIQQISGHSNVTTTMGIYAHTRLGLVQEAGGKVARLLQ